MVKGYLARVALERGPLVYCLEQHDQDKDVSVMDAVIDATAPVTENHEEKLLGGVVTLSAAGGVVDHEGWNGDLYRVARPSSQSTREAELKAIPYFAWANRGPAAMTVWTPRLMK